MIERPDPVRGKATDAHRRRAGGPVPDRSPRVLLASLLLFVLLVGCSGTRVPIPGIGRDRDHSCDPGTICLAIPGFSTPVESDRNRQQVIASALPEILQITLLRYPGFHLIPNSELWRAIQETYPDPRHWRPDRLQEPEVLRRAGANHVLAGRLVQRQGTIELQGQLIALADGNTWRRTIRIDPFPERRLLDELSTFAREIVTALAADGRLAYHHRRFVSVPFCVSSTTPAPSRNAALYATDLPRTLVRAGAATEAIDVTYRDEAMCLAADEAVALAAEAAADGVITGEIREESDGTLVLTAEIYLAELDLRQPIPLPAQALGYLELKYLLLDRFDQYLELAIAPDGSFNRDALSLDPDPRELLSQADDLIERNQLDAAEFLVERAAVLEPASPEVGLRSARIAYLRGHRREALEVVETVVSQDPSLPGAHALLGKIQLASRDYAAAQRAYETLARLEPDSPGAYVALGNLASLEGEPTSAIASYERALQVDPESDEARRRLADLYEERGWAMVQAGRFAEAYPLYDAALRAAPKPDAGHHFDRAFTFARAVASGELASDDGYAPAIEDYRRAIALHAAGDGRIFHRVDLAHLNLQELHLVDGNDKEAARAARTYLESSRVDPTFPAGTWEILARLHLVVAEILTGSDPGLSLEALRARIDDRRSVTDQGWSFDLLRSALADRRPSVKSDRLARIEALIAETERALATMGPSKK